MYSTVYYLILPMMIWSPHMLCSGTCKRIYGNRNSPADLVIVAIFRHCSAHTMAVFLLVCVGLHEPLIRHMSSLGYVHPALEVVPFDGRGAGLRLSQPVTEGQVLVGVPASLQLSWSAEANKLNIAKAVEQLLPQREAWDMRLAVALLAKCAAVDAGSSNGYWRAYISTLPKNVQSMPNFLSSAELHQLGQRYPTIPADVQARSSFLEALSREIQCSSRALTWAYSMVTSRAFCIDSGDASGSMLPLIDCANHAFEPSAYLLRLGDGLESLPSGSAGLIANRNIARGEEVSTCYGNFDNKHLLLDYGFEVASNPFQGSAV